jgi:hypothetical protein
MITDENQMVAVFSPIVDVFSPIVGVFSSILDFFCKILAFFSPILDFFSTIVAVFSPKHENDVENKDVSANENEGENKYGKEGDSHPENDEFEGDYQYDNEGKNNDENQYFSILLILSFTESIPLRHGLSSH